jgi:hypothetical protein
MIRPYTANPFRLLAYTFVHYLVWRHSQNESSRAVAPKFGKTIFCIFSDFHPREGSARSIVL